MCLRICLVYILFLGFHISCRNIGLPKESHASKPFDNTDKNRSVLDDKIQFAPTNGFIDSEEIVNGTEQITKRKPKTIYGLLGFLTGFRFAQGIGPTSYHADRREDAQLSLFSKLFDGALYLSYVKYPYFYPLATLIPPDQYPPVGNSDTELSLSPNFDYQSNIDDTNEIQSQMQQITQQLLMGEVKNDKYLNRYEKDKININSFDEKGLISIIPVPFQEDNLDDNKNTAKPIDENKEDASVNPNADSKFELIPKASDRLRQTAQENTTTTSITTTNKPQSTTTSTTVATTTMSSISSSSSTTSTSSPTTLSSSTTNSSPSSASTTLSPSSTSSTNLSSTSNSSTSPPLSSTSNTNSSASITGDIAIDKNGTLNVNITSGHFYPYPYYHYYANASSYEDVSITEIPPVAQSDFYPYYYNNLPAEYIPHLEDYNFGHSDYVEYSKHPQAFYPYNQYYVPSNSYEKHFYHEKPKYSMKLEDSGFVPLGTLNNKI